jgi:hypothetical protein
LTAESTRVKKQPKKRIDFKKKNFTLFPDIMTFIFLSEKSNEREDELATKWLGNQ